jgi:very-short-patch-repair endonuclease
VTVVGEWARAHEGIRVHRTGSLERRDWWIRDGIPLTAPARTILDLAAVLPYRDLRAAVRRAFALEHVSLRQLVEILGGAGRRRGVRNLARIVATGHAPTRSELENVVFDLIGRGGFERPEVNRGIELEGRRVIPDFRWSEQRLVVEADGHTWHDNPISREDDAERQALLEAHGDRVLRVTWEQAVARPAQTIARLRAAGAPLAR